MTQAMLPLITHPLPPGTRIRYAFADTSRGQVQGEATIKGGSYITKSPTLDVPAYAVSATTAGLQRIEHGDVAEVLSLGAAVPPSPPRDRLAALRAAGWTDVPAAPSQREAT